MTTTTLTNEALKTIDGYLHMKVGAAVWPVPYFNNKTVKARFSVRALIGKGSPDEIRDEIQSYLVKHHIAADSLADQTLGQLLAEHNVGVDCSALAYYVLDAESRARGQGGLNKHLVFLKGRGPMRKMISYLRPVENCDVKTLASDMNSRPVALADAAPGDMVTMLTDTNGGERNHILVVHAVEREGSAAKRISYTHSVAYPEDGIYQTGARQGTIDVIDASKPIAEQTWTENGSTNSSNRIFLRAKSSTTELRRLKWF